MSAIISPIAWENLPFHNSLSQFDNIVGRIYLVSWTMDKRRNHNQLCFVGWSHWESSLQSWSRHSSKYFLKEMSEFKHIPGHEKSVNTVTEIRVEFLRKRKSRIILRTEADEKYKIRNFQNNKIPCCSRTFDKSIACSCSVRKFPRCNRKIYIPSASRFSLLPQMIRTFSIEQDNGDVVHTLSSIRIWTKACFTFKYQNKSIHVRFKMFHQNKHSGHLKEHIIILTKK